MIAVKGYFITFEGPDGAGKSSQIRLLSDYLASKGFTTLNTYEPGEGEVGRKIRELILYSGLEITPRCEALLYAADRAQHVQEVILPALERGEVVICDRFIDSSIAYQGEGRGLGEEAVMSANELALAGIMPHVTFMFDLSPREAFLRKGGAESGDRIESAGLEFHEQVYGKFMDLAEKYPDRIVRIDARQTVEEISRQIIACVNEIMNLK